MDEYEATKTVMSRIQTLDPDNASKIMGFILLQDQGDKEMIRLAFSPDAILLSYVNRAKARFGLPSNPPSPTPFPQNPPPRILIPSTSGGFHMGRHRPVPYAPTGSGSGSPGLRFYGGGDLGGEYQLGSSPGGLDPIMSPGGRSDSLVFPYREDASPDPNPFHKRSCSVNDAAFLSNLDDGGCGVWRPCMYFARGFCKNGGACKFLHGGDGDPIEVGSPGENVSGFEELMRMKALQQQRFAAMGGAHHPFAYNRCMDLMSENLRLKPDRGDLSPLGLTIANSVARQIYLTFPADSTFKEEDVSSYFGMFGPVQDVRIPYQQKRMFGFVTFVYPETVKLILAKGNPHFVCDSRVLVKPYKEKGKFKEKKHSQQCLSPSGVDGEHLDTPFGPRMMFSPRELMLRRKLEQEAEMQHAIELEGRRMMNLQLMDLNNENNNYRYLQSLPAGVPYASPRNSNFPINQHFTSSSDSIHQENSEGFDRSKFDGGQYLSVGASEKKVSEGIDFFGNNSTDDVNKLHHGNSDDSDVHESLLEHNLPDNLFSSPTKSVAENSSAFLESNGGSVQISSSSCNNDPLLPDSSPLTIASLKSCYLQMPRFSSGQEAIEM